MNYQKTSSKSTESGKDKALRILKKAVTVLLIVSVFALTLSLFRDKPSYSYDTLEIPDDAESGIFNHDLNYAKTFSMNEKIFDVRFGQGQATSNGYLSTAASGSEIRLYASKDDGKGNYLTVTCKKNIISIVIEFSSNSGNYSINGKEYTKDTTCHVIGAKAFTIRNVGEDKVLIKSIDIIYER